METTAIEQKEKTWEKIPSVTGLRRLRATGVIYINKRLGKQYVCRSTGTDDLKIAKAKLAELVAEFTLLRTWKEVPGFADRGLSDFATLNPAKVSQADFESWRSYFAGVFSADLTNVTLGIFRTLYQIARKHNPLVSDPTTDVPWTKAEKEKPVQPDQPDPAKYSVTIIDGCEYLSFPSRYGSVIVTHKGNCTNRCHIYRDDPSPTKVIPASSLSPYEQS